MPELDLVNFLQLLVSGLSNGCVYGLVALGFVMIYKATEMVNFAQGDIMMLAAFVAITFSQYLGWSYIPTIGATIVVMALIGILTERVVLRPMIGEPQFAVLMLTIGLGYVIRAVAGTIWGHDPHQLVVPYSDWVLNVEGVILDGKKLVVVGGTIALCVALFVFFRYSRFGIAMQAASQNQLAAYYVGIPVKKIVSLTWAISAGIAAIAAVLVAPLWWVDPAIGLVGIKAFVAAIVGGFGSLLGAIIGGLTIGIVEAFAGFYIPGYAETSAYVLLLLMLFIRPQGLFATMQRKKV